MTDPKKRLEEILEEKFGISLREIGLFSEGVIDNLMIQAITEILKDFVHKDNLPSVDDIDDVIDEYTDCEISSEGMHFSYMLSGLAEAIRELIEGKK